MEEELKLKKEQNAILSELNNSITELKVNNTLLMQSLEENNNKLLEDMKSVIADERDFKREMLNDINHEVSNLTVRVKEDTAKKVEETITNSKYQLQRFCDDSEKKVVKLMNYVETAMDKMKVYTTLQKIFFWLTPIAVLVQTIITTYLLLK